MTLTTQQAVIAFGQLLLTYMTTEGRSPTQWRQRNAVFYLRGLRQAVGRMEDALVSVHADGNATSRADIAREALELASRCLEIHDQAVPLG